MRTYTCRLYPSTEDRRNLKETLEHVANCRLDFLHKRTTTSVEHYDTIILEDVAGARMHAGSRYAKSNVDAAWGLCKQLLLYKAERAGAAVMFVAPRETTQTCATCGSHVSKAVWERKHTCPTCGLTVHRDYHAARIILQRGLEKLDRGQVEVTPVETGASTLTNVNASSVVEARSPSLVSVAN